MEEEEGEDEIFLLEIFKQEERELTQLRELEGRLSELKTKRGASDDSLVAHTAEKCAVLTRISCS